MLANTLSHSVLSREINDRQKETKNLCAIPCRPRLTSSAYIASRAQGFSGPAILTLGRLAHDHVDAVLVMTRSEGTRVMGTVSREVTVNVCLMAS